MNVLNDKKWCKCVICQTTPNNEYEQKEKAYGLWIMVFDFCLVLNQI